MKTLKLLNRIIISLTLIASLFGCGSSGSESPTDAAQATSDNSVSTIDTPVTVAPVQNAGVAKLAWDAPLYQDPTQAPVVAGYKIHYGTSPDSLKTTVDVGATTQYTINDLATGTYYFAVTVYDQSGNESVMSNVMSKIIT